MAKFNPVGTYQPLINDVPPTAVPWTSRYRGPMVHVHTQLRKSFNLIHPKSIQTMFFDTIRDRINSVGGQYQETHPYAIEQIATAIAKNDMTKQRVLNMTEADLEINDRHEERKKANTFLAGEIKRDSDIANRASQKAKTGDMSPTSEWDEFDAPTP